jgi:hypothetical protein
MPSYIVTTEETVHHQYKVEANAPEDAWEAVALGHVGEIMDVDYLGFEVVSVEEEDD